nr:immunoglobulin light chain junction region [Macaca mulatta]
DYYCSSYAGGNSFVLF